MRVRVTMPTAVGKRLREKILEGAEKVEDDEMGNEEWEVVRLSSSPSPLGTMLTCCDSCEDHADRPRSVPRHQRAAAERMQRQGKDRDDVVCCDDECYLIYAVQGICECSKPMYSCVFRFLYEL